MDVSVVVPVRDGARTLPALLASLAGQTLARDRFEVVVVDNASNDESAEIARASGAVVIHEPVPNRSRARNAGVRAARSDVIAFTDADCVAAPGWLEAFVAHRGDTPLVAGPVRMSTREPPGRVERFEQLWRSGQEHWVRDGWAATANLRVERAAFDAVGGFDPAYRHIGEDADFCLRAGRAGHALGWCPDAVVTHAAETEVWPMLKRAFFNGYGADQCLHRLGTGHRAWRELGPLVSAPRALRFIGAEPTTLPPGQRRPLGTLARLAYGSRVLGSLWAEARAAR